MPKALERRYFYKRCILHATHSGECEWNDFDPPEEYVRCLQHLYQPDGGPDAGKWVRMNRIVF